MDSLKVSGETTYVLKWNTAVCPCDGHKREVRERLNKIGGVKIEGEGKIDIGNGRGTAIINISSTVDAHTVTEEFQKDEKIKNVELILSKESSPPSQIVLRGQRRAPPPIVSRRQRHGISNTALDNSTSRKKTINCSHSKLEEINYNKRFTCDKCREDGFGFRHRCERKKCGYELHKECKERLRTKTIELFKEKITFDFCRTQPVKGKSRCNACGGRIHGCFYKSAKWNLHPRCSSFKAEISVQDTIVRLSEKASLIECLWCNNNESRGWSYVSNRKNCRLHLCCVPKIWQHLWKVSNHDAEDDSVVDISKSVKTINSELELKAKSKKNGAWKSFLKIATVLVKTAISIVLGDPTGLLLVAVGQVLNIGSN